VKSASSQTKDKQYYNNDTRNGFHCKRFVSTIVGFNFTELLHEQYLPMLIYRLANESWALRIFKCVSLDHPFSDQKNTPTNSLLLRADNHSLNINWILYLTRRMWEIKHNITTWHQEYSNPVCAYSAVNVFTYHIFTSKLIGGKYCPLVSYTISSLLGTTSHHRRLSTLFTPSYFIPLISNVQKPIKIPQFTLSFYCFAFFTIAPSDGTC